MEIDWGKRRFIGSLIAAGITAACEPARKIIVPTTIPESNPSKSNEQRLADVDKRQKDEFFRNKQIKLPLPDAFSDKGTIATIYSETLKANFLGLALDKPGEITFPAIVEGLVDVADVPDAFYRGVAIYWGIDLQYGLRFQFNRAGTPLVKRTDYVHMGQPIFRANSDPRNQLQKQFSEAETGVYAFPNRDAIVAISYLVSNTDDKGVVIKGSHWEDLTAEKNILRDASGKLVTIPTLVPQPFKSP